MAIAESNRADQLHVNKVLRTKLESDPEAVERDKHLQKMFAERTGLNLELKKATDELVSIIVARGEQPLVSYSYE